MPQDMGKRALGQRVFPVGEVSEKLAAIGRRTPTFYKSPIPHQPSEGMLRAEGPTSDQPGASEAAHRGYS